MEGRGLLPQSDTRPVSPARAHVSEPSHNNKPAFPREIAKGSKSLKRIGPDVQGGFMGSVAPRATAGRPSTARTSRATSTSPTSRFPVPPAAPARAVRRFTRVAPRRRFPMTRRRKQPTRGAPAASAGRRHRSRGSPEAAPASGVPRPDAEHTFRACAGRPAPAALPCAAQVGPCSSRCDARSNRIRSRLARAGLLPGLSHAPYRPAHGHPPVSARRRWGGGAGADRLRRVLGFRHAGACISITVSCGSWWCWWLSALSLLLLAVNSRRSGKSGSGNLSGVMKCTAPRAV